MNEWQTNKHEWMLNKQTWMNTKHRNIHERIETSKTWINTKQTNMNERKIGRILNITINPISSGQPPVLLNYKTSPNVTIARYKQTWMNNKQTWTNKNE